MRHLPASRTRFLVAEPLEARRLLSAAQTDSVQVLERDVSDDGVTDVAVELSNLPKPVLAGLHDRFPGAKPIEGTFSSDDGPEFELTAQLGDRLIDVTLTPTGSVVEIGTPVSSSELPRAVLDWVRQNMSKSEIVDAALVTKGDAASYELLIASPGHQEFDITLRVQKETTGALNRTARLNSLAFSKVEAGRPADRVSDGSDLQTPSQISNLLEPRSSPTRAETGSQPNGQTCRTASASSKLRLVRHPESSGDARGEGNDQSALNLIATRGLSCAIWMRERPVEVIRCLANSAVVKLESLERQLAHTLGTIDLLIETAVKDASTDAKVWRLALVGAFITAGQLVLRFSKRRKREPVLVTNVRSTSWCWVIGAAVPKRK